MVICSEYGMPPVVYVAGPYRAQTEAAFSHHIQAAERMGLALARKGWAPIIPHLNTGRFDQKAPDVGDDFWLAATSALLLRADAVILLSNWQNSAGTKAEVKLAKAYRIPVFDALSDLGKATDWPARLKSIQHTA